MLVLPIPEKGSQHLINVCWIYKYLKVSINLFYDCFKPVFILKHHPSKFIMENLIFKELESFNTLNIHNLSGILLIMAFLWWGQSKSFKLYIKHCCQSRRKTVYTMLKVLNKFYVLTTKYHSISQRNQIRIITCPRWQTPQLNWWEHGFFTQYCK